MKLNLSILKNVLIIEGDDDEINEWVRENIGEGEVGIKEWLDEFNKFWCEWSDDYGDSEEIKKILVNDYKLSDDDINEVMCEYWECESIEELKRDYNCNYDEYKE
jgi:hypothetical protein